MRIINNLLKKYDEIIRYLIVGVLTTFISLLTYYVLVCTIFNPNIVLELQIANTISWIISVIFAYFTNKKYVFKANNDSSINEIISFYLSRIFVLIIDMLLMYIFVSLLKFDDKITKLIVQIFVIVSNYFFSKFIVFKGGLYNEKK